MGCFTERRFERKFKPKTEINFPVYERSMPKYRIEHPDRDYSVNRAERRKWNKKKGRVV